MDAAFFNAVRPLFGGSLKQSQVDGLASSFGMSGLLLSTAVV